MQRLVFSSILVVLSTWSVMASADTKVEPEVLQELAESSIARVIIVTRPDPNVLGGGQSLFAPQAYVAFALRSAEAQVRRLGSFRAVATTVSASQLEGLREDPNIEAIYSNIPVPPATDATIKIIGADKMHAQGYHGTDLAVAVLDTGIEATHPAFANAIVAEACFSTTSGGSHPSQSACPGGLDLSIVKGAAGHCPKNADGCDHGSHVAGIIAGRKYSYSGKHYQGVSPGARLVPIQVFSIFTNTADCRGSAPCALSYPSDQLRALDWVLKRLQEFRIAAVNMSLGGGYYDAVCDTKSALTEPIERLKAKGVPTVISAGNDAFYDGTGMPGCISSAVTVAATTKAGELDLTYSNQAAFVDITAPGTNIVSAVPGSSYASMSGTSMAAPHVAGAFALLRQEYPGASADELLSKLLQGAPSVTAANTGLTFARLELSHTLPSLTTGSGGPVGPASNPEDEPTDIAQSFILTTTSASADVQGSLNAACEQEGCALKRISDRAWKLDVSALSSMAREKGMLTAEEVRDSLPSLPPGTKIFANTPLAAPN